MRLSKLLVICILFFLMLGTISCEDSSNSSSASGVEINRNSDIKYINYQRSQLEMVDGWTLNLIGTIINIQRPSCSGFDQSNPSGLIVGERVEYTFIDNEEVDYAQRTVIPTEVKQYRSDCEPGNDRPQYILDTDRDGYTDNIDAFPTDPTQH